MNSCSKNITRSSVTWKNWKYSFCITADKHLLHSCCKGEPQGSYLKETSAYSRRSQPSACLHCEKENIQAIREDACLRQTDLWIHLVFDSTNSLRTDMPKKYIVVRYHTHKELKQTKPTILVVFKWLTDLTYLQISSVKKWAGM